VTALFYASRPLPSAAMGYAPTPAHACPPRACTASRFLRGSACVLHTFHSTYYTGYILY
jgi:hypothetical protein